MIESARTAVRRHPLLSYLGLAYTLSWAPSLQEPHSIFPWGPFLAALAVTGMTGGRTGVLVLVRRLAQWRVGVGWYALVLGLPVVVDATALALTVATGADAGRLDRMPSVGNVVPWFATALALVALGEEPGWRGFALPRLLERFSPLKATLVLGALHAVWHLPLVGTEYDGGNLLPWLLGMLASSFVLTWMYVRTGGNLVLPVLLHTAVNTTARFVFPLFDGADLVRLWWLWAALWWVAALLLVSRWGEWSRLPGRPRRTCQAVRSYANVESRTDDPKTSTGGP